MRNITRYHGFAITAGPPQVVLGHTNKLQDEARSTGQVDVERSGGSKANGLKKKREETGKTKQVT